MYAPQGVVVHLLRLQAHHESPLAGVEQIDPEQFTKGRLRDLAAPHRIEEVGAGQAPRLARGDVGVVPGDSLAAVGRLVVVHDLSVGE
jgi:hypothetical protein